jgi:hypothetical protein
MRQEMPVFPCTKGRINPLKLMQGPLICFSKGNGTLVVSDSGCRSCFAGTVKLLDEVLKLLREV